MNNGNKSQIEIANMKFKDSIPFITIFDICETGLFSKLCYKFCKVLPKSDMISFNSGGKMFTLFNFCISKQNEKKNTQRDLLENDTKNSQKNILKENTERDFSRNFQHESTISLKKLSQDNVQKNLMKYDTNENFNNDSINDFHKLSTDIAQKNLLKDDRDEKNCETFVMNPTNLNSLADNPHSDLDLMMDLSKCSDFVIFVISSLHFELEFFEMMAFLKCFGLCKIIVVVKFHNDKKKFSFIKRRIWKEICNGIYVIDSDHIDRICKVVKAMKFRPLTFKCNNSFIVVDKIENNGKIDEETRPEMIKNIMRDSFLENNNMVSYKQTERKVNQYKNKKSEDENSGLKKFKEIRDKMDIDDTDEFQETSKLHIHNGLENNSINKLATQHDKQSLSNSHIIKSDKSGSYPIFSYSVYGYVRGCPFESKKFHIPGKGDFDVLEIQKLTNPCSVEKKLLDKNKLFVYEPEFYTEMDEGFIKKSYNCVSNDKNGLINIDFSSESDSDDLELFQGIKVSKLEQKQIKFDLSNNNTPSTEQHMKPEKIEKPDTKSIFETIESLKSKLKPFFEQEAQTEIDYINKFNSKEKITRIPNDFGSKTQTNNSIADIQTYDDILIPGSYVKITFLSKQLTFSKLTILAALQTSHKIVLQGKVKKNNYFNEIMKSNEEVLISYGWFRYYGKVIFSIKEDVRNRFLKYLNDGMFCNASFYGNVISPGSSFCLIKIHGRKTIQNANESIDSEDDSVNTCNDSNSNKNTSEIYNNNLNSGSFRIAAFGQIQDITNNPSIVKKIKIIGHPYKIYENTAFIKDMFSSEKEAIKFEKGLIKTVSNIRGIIKKGLKNGNVRCTFEARISLSDIVFMRCYVNYNLDDLKYIQYNFEIKENTKIIDKNVGINNLNEKGPHKNTSQNFKNTEEFNSKMRDSQNEKIISDEFDDDLFEDSEKASPEQTAYDLENKKIKKLNSEVKKLKSNILLSKQNLPIKNEITLPLNPIQQKLFSIKKIEKSNQDLEKKSDKVESENEKCKKERLMKNIIASKLAKKFKKSKKRRV